ncbi:hypothetical protein ACVHNB_32760 [Streptomyces sp. YJ-C3]
MSERRYVARYMRLQKQGAMECESLDRAVAFLSEGADSGQCSPVGVLGPDGAVVLSGDDLRDRMDEYRGLS